MSNQFPHHPLPFSNVVTLAAATDAFEAVAAPVATPVDVLVVSPPAASPAGEPNVVRVAQSPSPYAGCVRVVNKGANPVDVTLLLKSGGNEYIIDTALALATGAADTLGGASPLTALPILPSDDGLFLRLNSLLGTTVDIAATYKDVRGLEVEDIVVPQNVKTPLLQGADADTALLASAFNPIVFLNPDVAPQTVLLALDDGSDEVQLSSTAGDAIPAGEARAVAFFEIVVAKDGALNVVRTTAAAEDLIARVIFSRTNSGPAKPFQGGAF